MPTYKNALVGEGPEIEVLRRLTKHMQSRGIDARLLIKAALQVPPDQMQKAQEAANEFSKMMSERLQKAQGR